MQSCNVREATKREEDGRRLPNDDMASHLFSTPSVRITTQILHEVQLASTASYSRYNLLDKK